MDLSLVLTPLGAADFPTSSLPSELTFCSNFREWNAVRSLGAGAGRTPAGPIRLCEHPPPAGYKAQSLGGKSADLHVVVRTTSLLAEGLRLFRVDGEASSGEASGGVASGGDAKTSSATGGESGGPGADAAGGAEGASRPPADLERLVCIGDEETNGTVGPWHFDRVVSARDGSEMMCAAEVEPLREARVKKVASLAAAAKAKVEAEAARKAKREEKRMREDHAAEQAQMEPPPKKFNPYLAHMKDDEEGEEHDEDEVY